MVRGRRVGGETMLYSERLEVYNDTAESILTGLRGKAPLAIWGIDKAHCPDPVPTAFVVRALVRVNGHQFLYETSLSVRAVYLAKFDIVPSIIDQFALDIGRLIVNHREETTECQPKS